RHVAALGLPTPRVHGRRDRRRRLDQGRERELEVPGQIAQRHPVLRPPRASEARLDGREVEREGVGIHRLRRGARVEQALLLHVRLDQLHLRSEEHTSELQSLAYLVCRLLLEKKKKTRILTSTLRHLTQPQQTLW